jgi:polar amino acid transport system substrate-binding protein
MKSKVWFTISLLVLFGMMLSACQGGGKKKVKVVMDATWPPFELVDEKTKELKGFDIDLMKAIAEKEGMDVEFVNITFDSALAGLAQCQYDAAISAITITDERKKNMLFSEPYFAAGQIVTVNKNNTDINSKDDLAGKKIGAMIGTTGAIEAEKIRDAKGAQYKAYDTIDLAFLDVMSGQLDAVIADNPLAIGFIGKNSDKLKAVGDVFTDENYGIAVCNKQPELLQKINEGLKAVMAEGIINKLTEKWLVSQ